MKNQTEVFTATIESLNHDGRGVAKINGKTIFIENALPEETVEFIYLKKHRHYDEGKTTTILQPSLNRTEPHCAHFGICGGCSLQHLQGSAQIHFKQQILLDQLSHIAQITPQEILPPLGATIWGYRHKARLGVKYVIKKNKVLVGFREKNSNFLTDLQSCAVLHPHVGEKITAVAELIHSLINYRAIPQIEIAIANDQTAFIFRHLEPLPQSDLDKLIEFSKKHLISIYLQPQGPDSIALLWPPQQDASLEYQINSPKLRFQFQPSQFTQINPAINQKMIAQALKLLSPQRDEKLLDLFCGVGNFSLPLAQFAGHVTGIEGDKQLVNQALKNAALNQIQNVNFYISNLMSEFKWAEWARQSYDKILLDPPRSGAAEVVQYIKHFGAHKILYISCNPATLARDSKELVAQGYVLTKAGVMDMFPHTSHVEAMALFEKNN